MIALDIWYKGTGFGFTLFFWGIDFQVKLLGKTLTVNKGKWKGIEDEMDERETEYQESKNPH